MTAAIETAGLSKTFGSLRAVDSLTLEVRSGEVFGFLGPNGAGKTTTIRMLMGFLRPTSGVAEVLGCSPADPATRSEIGYLPGDLKLPQGYSGRDLFRYFGALRGFEDWRRTEDLCRAFDLDDRRPVGELSTGNRRKIGIVQAFMHRPRLLILDEPTAGLDPLLQHQFQALVRESVNEGATVFLSSHMLGEVEALADRVGIIRKGILLSVATMDELRARARHRLRFHTTERADPNAFSSVSGVVSATAHGGVLEVVVEGSVDAVLKAAAQLTVERVETPGDDLEDIFMQFYRDSAE